MEESATCSHLVTRTARDMAFQSPTLKPAFIPASPSFRLAIHNLYQRSVGRQRLQPLNLLQARPRGRVVPFPILRLQRAHCPDSMALLPNVPFLLEQTAPRTWICPQLSNSSAVFWEVCSHPMSRHLIMFNSTSILNPCYCNTRIGCPIICAFCLTFTETG